MPAKAKNAPRSRRPAPQAVGASRWKLQDAKAQLSKLVRLAHAKGPQRITVHGRDAVVVLAAEEYARLAPLAALPSLHALLSRSPLRDLEFEHAGVRANVRDVEL